jgi:cytochrome c peroxidase
MAPTDDPSASSAQLFAALYHELHAVAQRRLRGLPFGATLSTTTLLHEALISGHCADLGRIKGPILRGLASRAPFFHNGAAASIEQVVEFYNARFQINLTAQEKSDLVAFLRSL